MIGSITADEFRARLEGLGLAENQSEAARQLGTAPYNVNRYLHEARPVPTEIVRTLELLEQLRNRRRSP